MTQAIVFELAVEREICATCPYFQSHKELEQVTDEKGQSFHNPRHGCRWCKLFDHFCREHHEITNDCIVSSDLAVNCSLEDNLTLFSEVDFEEIEVGNVPAEEIINKADKPYSEYQMGSIVKVIDFDKDYTEWAAFEVIECRYYKNLRRDLKNYLNEFQWYYRLACELP